MQFESIKNAEKSVNNMMFIYILGIAISGWSFVMVFLNGGIRECIFLLSGLSAILTKVFEKKLGGVAKYIYACIPPVIGAITCAVCNTNDSASYVCITHYYFVATLLLVPYYDLKLIRVSTIVTIVVNAGMMIAFPTGFLKLHNLIGWIFTGFIYLVLFAVCTFISYHTNVLFGVIEQKAIETKSYENQIEVMKQSEYKVHALRHDMKHHLQGIYVMTQNEERQKVLRYLERMQKSLINPGEYVTTGNQKMDAILNYILAKAEQMNIKVEQKVKVSRKIPIEAYELNIILGNLLENAIEAANESLEKYLYLHIVENKGMLMIHIKNSYSGKLLTFGERFISTKSGTKHGYGIINVKKIVESHKGIMNVTYDEKEFRVEVTLYL